MLWLLVTCQSTKYSSSSYWIDQIIPQYRDLCTGSVNRKCSGPCFNTLRPRQNGHRFPDDIFKRIFMNENIWVSIKVSLKFVPKGPINNIPALVQIMAWRRPGDKPLSEPMMDILLTHLCVTRPQWVNIKKRLSLYMVTMMTIGRSRPSHHYHVNLNTDKTVSLYLDTPQVLQMTTHRPK